MSDDFSKATPRPWRYLDDGEGHEEIVGLHDELIAEMRDANYVDGPLIVAAVNAFDPDREKKVEALVEALGPIARYGEVLRGQWVRHDDPLIELWDHKISGRDLVRVAEALHSLKGGENG